MGVHDRTHPGQRLATERRDESSATDQQCGFCGARVPESEASERVDHVLPTNGGRETRTECYCSPGCFVRQMDSLSQFE